MKLLQTVNRRYIAVSLSVLIGGGLAFYFILKSILDEQLTEQLYLDKQFIETHYNNGIYDSAMFMLPGIDIQIAQQGGPDVLTDTLQFNQIENEEEPVRQLVFYLQTPQIIYRICLTKTLYEKEDLILTITWILGGIIIFQLVLSFLISRYINKKLFTPFFSTLHIMRSYSAGNTKKLSLEATKVREFQQLNNAFKNMHARLQLEYVSLKEFTENASHEFQTPLAIIQSKLELISNDTYFTQHHGTDLNVLMENLQRLSRLNKQLLLITSISNEQFGNRELISLNIMLQKKTESFHELIQLKSIKLITQKANDLIIEISPELLDIMLNNLFSNALKHTDKGGEIQVILQDKKLKLKNTSTGGALPVDKIFQRFYKTQNSGDSSGLGLAIVNQIAQSNNFRISYAWENGFHCFILEFDNAKVSA